MFFPKRMFFGHIPVEKLLMHSQLRNSAVFSEAVYIYFTGQIWLDAGDAEARAKCSFLICVTSAVTTVIRTRYQFYPVLAPKV